MLHAVILHKDLKCVVLIFLVYVSFFVVKDWYLAQFIY